jgi:multicomponent K+:H+ antiporter subunit F
VLAFDTLYINTIALMIVLDIYHSTSVFFEAALLIALTGFIATAALARYLARGNVME